MSRSEWAGWQTRLAQLHLEDWTPEWQDRLHAPASSAVDLNNGDVALSVIETAPLDVELLLFHELAHLIHWDMGGGSGRVSSHARLLDNETFAWSETFKWGEYLRAEWGVRTFPSWYNLSVGWVELSGSVQGFASAALESRGMRELRP